MYIYTYVHCFVLYTKFTPKNIHKKLSTRYLGENINLHFYQIIVIISSITSYFFKKKPDPLAVHWNNKLQ